MPTPSSPPLSADAATLLVLLPTLAPAAQGATTAALRALQQRLGPAIRVLRIDEASHPAVVRSFDGCGRPAYVLVRQGMELWRQQGIPEGEATAALLLSKLAPAPA